MMATLWRHDATIRHLPRSVGVTAGVGSMLLGVILSLSLWRTATLKLPPDTEGNFVLCICAIWAVLSLHLLGPDARARASSLPLALPIRARTIWSSHSFALFTSGLLIVGFMGGVIALLSEVAFRLEGLRLFPDRAFLDMAFYLPGALALAVAVGQIHGSSLASVHFSRRRFTFYAVVLLGILGITLGLLSLPRVFAIVPVLAALFLAFRTRSLLPPALSLVPREPAADTQGAPRLQGKADSAQAGPHTGIGYWWLVIGTVHRVSAKKAILPFTIYPFIMVLGFTLSGFFSRWTAEGEFRFTLIIITIYLLLAGSGGLMTNLHRVDFLALSRRRIFAILTLPSLAVFIFGYGAGALGMQFLPRQELIRYVAADDCYCTLIPVAWCEIAWDGNVPDNGSPWGESHASWQVPLIKGSRPTIFSTLTTVEASSKDFIAHQISGATAVVYDRRIPAEEIADRYLEADTSGKILVKGGTLTLAEDYPDLRARHRGPAFPVILMLVCIPWLALTWIYLRFNRAHFGDSVSRRVTWLMLGLLLVLHAAQYVILLGQFTEPWIIAGFMKVLIRETGERAPGGAWFVWVLSAFLLYTVYRWTGRGFEGIDVRAPREMK